MACSQCLPDLFNDRHHLYHPLVAGISQTGWAEPIPGERSNPDEVPPTSNAESFPPGWAEPILLTICSAADACPRHPSMQDPLHGWAWASPFLSVRKAARSYQLA